MTNFNTPDLCDAIESAGDIPQATVAFSDFGGVSNFYGAIATVLCFEDNGKVRTMLETQGNGRVLVVDGGASRHCALVGGNLAELAKKNGWMGIIVNGCVRDTEELAATAVGVKALAAMPRRSQKRGSGETDVTVQFDGLTFVPGHYVYADEDGIVVCEKHQSL
ncbi:ribonuclease E activity regulator RraA [Candidatus Persebacteraceae bacterium Df01]|jgi:regulator of ribonuclease activity A|uniref:4-hydroxy-4-methyl-2-oxoglutarate aldolase n=1 Tax=Candidatus Doriopsillibacter californiensis TaxID=2970740 RepID=A0ABT7QN21_9GAMM|nr:ribonuclease E activity regulator RraA [Candidatus Persebacteraceae bacterium Df01]